MRTKIVKKYRIKLKNRRVVLTEYADGSYRVATKRLAVVDGKKTLHSSNMLYAQESMFAMLRMFCESEGLQVVRKNIDHAAIENIPVKHVIALANALGLDVKVLLELEGE